MEAVRERVVPVMTKRERQEMLNLQEQGELPENIDCSTDLYFRFLLGTPAQGRLLRDMLSWTLVKQEDRGSDGVVQEYWSSSEKRYYPLRKLERSWISRRSGRTGWRRRRGSPGRRAGPKAE